MAPKERPRGGWARQAGREGSFTIASCVHDLARVAGARMRTGDPRRIGASASPFRSGALASNGRALNLSTLARAAPFSRSCALRVCAGRSQLRTPRGDRVAAVQGDQGLENRHATRERAERRWWSVVHDPELDQLMRVVAISNQTVKADEANYRQALALINEARAGLFLRSTVRAPRPADCPAARI